MVIGNAITDRGSKFETFESPLYVFRQGVIGGGRIGQKADLVLPRLLALVMIKMARVVANLVDVRGHVAGQAIVFLQIDR